MSGLYAVEIEPEVCSWLSGLTDRDFGRAVFRKKRGAEVAEVARAIQTQKRCEAEHGPAHDTFDREVET